MGRISRFGARLLDAFTSPFRSGGRGPYDAAGTGTRWRGFNAPMIGPNAALAVAGGTMQNRAAAMERNNPWAYGAREAFVGNVVGTGIQAKSKHPDLEIRKAIQELWQDSRDELDADGINDFDGLQWVAASGIRRSGDVFARLRPRRLEDGLAVPLQVQLLDGAMCPYWKNEVLADGVIICGIEFDKIGRRRGYHFYREHPGEMVTTRVTAGDTVFVPADQVVHAFRRTIPGQVRGEMALARAAATLNEIDEYGGALLIRAKNAAHIGGMIEAPDPEKVPDMIGDRWKDQTAEEAFAGITLKSGTMPILPPGFKLEQFEAPDIGAGFGELVRHQLRAIAQASDTTYEQVTGDMSDVSFTSGRMAELQNRRRVEPWQWQVMVFLFCRGIWRAWMDAAVLSGALRIPGYASNKRLHQRVAWRPPAWEYTDPSRQTAADLAKVRAGVKSLDQWIQEQGGDPDEVEAEINAWNARADRDGRVSEADPRKVTSSGVAVGLAADPAADPAPKKAAGGRRG